MQAYSLNKSNLKTTKSLAVCILHLFYFMSFYIHVKNNV